MSSYPRLAQDQQLDHSEWNHAVRGESELLAALFATLWFVVPLVHLVRHWRT